MNLVKVTVFMNSVIEVFEGCAPLLVSQEYDFVFGVVAHSQVPSNVVRSVVSRGIVDDDESVVAVVLLQDRLDVPGIPIAGDVVEGWGDNAPFDLVGVVIHFVLFVEILLFPFD